MIITIERAEGPISDCLTISTRSFKDANAHIKIMARTAPESGYDKVLFNIEFDNGEKYDGRLDMKRKHKDEEDILQNHITDYCNYVLKHNEYKEFHDEAYNTLKLLIGA